MEGIEILCPKGWSELEVGFVGDGQFSLVLFQQFCCSHHFLNSVYLFVIAAEWSVVIKALVLGIGYDLAGQTQNTKFCFARFELLTVGLLKIMGCCGVSAGKVAISGGLFLSRKRCQH